MESSLLSLDSQIPDWLWNSANQLILIVDRRGYPVAFSPAMSKVIKRNIELNKDSLEAIFKYPNINARAFLKLLHKSNQQKITMAIISGVNGSQNLIWSDWEFSKIEADEEELYVGVGGVSHDVIDQGMYRSISKAILEGAFLSITDPKGLIISTNKHFADFTEYSENELIGKRHKEVLSDNNSKEFWHTMLRVIRSGQIWNDDVMIKTKSGKVKWLHTIVSPVLSVDGDISRVVYVQFDISDAKKVLKHEESLKQIAFMQSHEFRRPVANMLGIFDLINSDPDVGELPRGIAVLMDMLKQSVSETDEIIAKIVSKASEGDDFLV